MKIGYILFLIVFIGTAGAFGWGMRGAIIGGEKGAMLPGALIGSAIALLSGSTYLQNNAYLLAGMGALAMYCGGNMTYAETFRLSEPSKTSKEQTKGYMAIFIKGGIWFGLFCGYIALYITALSGGLSLLRLLIFALTLPASALVFYFIFNKPYKPEIGKFPRVYFSETKKETWGGLLGMLIHLAVFSAATKDFAALAVTAGGILSGGLGWMGARFIQVKTDFPDKKGKIFFGDSARNGLIDSWKIMECSFGAFASVGTGLTFFICTPLFKESFAILDTYGSVSVISEKSSTVLFSVYTAVLFFDCLQYFISPKSEFRYQKKLLKNHLISKEAYEKAISEIKPVESASYKRYRKLVNAFEFPIYSFLPMLLGFAGCKETVRTAAFSLILLVLCEEYVEQRIVKEHGSRILKAVILLSAFVLMFAEQSTGRAFPARLAFLLYTAVYEAGWFVFKKSDSNSKIVMNEKTVHGFFILCCLVLNMIAIMY